MLDALEVLPEVLDGLVRLEVQVRFRVFDACHREVFLRLAKKHRGYAPVRVSGVDPDEGEIENPGFLDRAQQTDQGRGGHAAARLLDGFPNRGEDEAEANRVFVLIEDHRDEAKVDDEFEALHEALLDVLGEGNRHVEGVISLLAELEEFLAIFLQEVLRVLRLAEMEVVAFHDEIREAGETLTRFSLEEQAAFEPIDFLGITMVLDEALIIGIVVLLLERREVIEALDEEAFAFHIAEAEGADDLVHPEASRPILDGAKKHVRDLLVVDAVEAVETDALLLPFLVGNLLENADDAPDDLFAVIDAVAHVIRLVAVKVIILEKGKLVRVETRDEIGVSLIEAKREIDEIPNLFSRFDFS